MCGNMHNPYGFRSRALSNKELGRPNDFITNFDICEENVYRKAIEIFSSKSTGIHLSIDDALAPRYAPANYHKTHKSLRCTTDPGVYDDLHEFWEIFYELRKSKM